MKYQIIGLLALVFLLSGCVTEDKNEVIEDLAQIAIVVPKVITKYGIELSTYRFIEERIKKNQNMADIFLSHNLNYDLVLKASDMDSIFDITKINTGDQITYFYSKEDSIVTPDYIVYRMDLKSYVVLDFRDSLNMYVGHKEKEVRLRQVSGEIKSSLWNAMTDINVSPMLAIELSEVYAWSIDFFGLQKGDHFSIVYEESYIDSVFYDIEKIHAIRFDQANHFYYAYRFEQDSIWNFFDENGNSLRKAFLKAPLRFSRISSRFSHSRMHPVLKIRRPHHGVDYAAPKGTPVYSVGDGKVVKKGWDKGGGRYVRIKHNSVYSTVYMHFSKFAKGIKVGDFIQQGQVVGYVGSSGLATGPHLDFRFYQNGKPVNPLKVKSPPVEPIKEENMMEFKKVVLKYQSTLDSLITMNHPETDSLMVAEQ